MFKSDLEIRMLIFRQVHVRRLRPSYCSRPRYLTMQSANRLRAVFAANKGPSMGLWKMLPGANVSRILARTGVDWVMIDCEHGNIDG